MKISTVVVAAGDSRRMGGTVSKVLLPLCGKPVLARTLEALAESGCIAEIVIAARPQDLVQIQALIGKLGLLVPVRFSPGGATRQESVAHAAALCRNANLIAVHDGARPLVEPADVRRVCADAARYGAAALAVPVKDTVKSVDGEGFVAHTPDRASLRSVQTPQVFRAALFFAALEKAEAAGKSYSDDCQLIESAGGRVFLTPGDPRNIKLTSPEDLLIAEAFLRQRESTGAPEREKYKEDLPCGSDTDTMCTRSSRGAR